MQINCLDCNKLIEQKNKFQKRCVICAANANRKNNLKKEFVEEKICVSCGKVFQAYSTSGKHCSPDCLREQKVKRMNAKWNAGKMPKKKSVYHIPDF